MEGSRIRVNEKVRELRPTARSTKNPSVQRTVVEKEVS